MEEANDILRILVVPWIIPLFLVLACSVSFAEMVIVDHTCTDITQIPETAINQAKDTLHIAYGHTSHGSQLTTGMSGLVGFANNGGLGLSLPQDIFAWNNGGTGGALDLEEGDGYGSGWLDHDCGYYPNWVDETRAYLDDPSHWDVNVIIWSWCGQASSRTEQGMIDTYLDPMSQLEVDYPNVIFVYMTGHADGSGETGNLHLRNQQIRDHCIANDKVLFDFYDIECYDPDDNYFGDKNVDDDCSYSGGNWAIEWQDSHAEGFDWYSYSSAHSQPLNANRKAYAAWWLWARLAGWNPNSDTDNDGVPDQEERGPDGTDPDYSGNDDGPIPIPDSQQGNVASGHTYDNQHYVTLAVPNPMTLSDCRFVGNPSPADASGGLEFEHGFFGFTIGIGGATTMTIYLPDGAAPTTYYKYGPTPTDLSDHWYEFMYDGQTGAEINGSVITLHFVDGERGDDDLLPDGDIEDVGGPGFPVVQPQSAPTTIGGGGGGGGGCFIDTAAHGMTWMSALLVLALIPAALLAWTRMKKAA